MKTLHVVVFAPHEENRWAMVYDNPKEAQTIYEAIVQTLRAIGKDCQRLAVPPIAIQVPDASE